MTAPGFPRFRVSAISDGPWLGRSSRFPGGFRDDSVTVLDRDATVPVLFAPERPFGVRPRCPQGVAFCGARSLGSAVAVVALVGNAVFVQNVDTPGLPRP